MVLERCSVLKSLKEQLQTLTLKKKLEYLFEYYSFHAIGAIIVIIVLVMTIHSFTNRQEEILSVRVVKEGITTEQTKELQILLEQSLIKSDNEIVSIEAINSSDTSNNPNAFVTNQKLAAEIAAKEVDVLLIDENAFRQFNEEGNLYDLSKIQAFDNWQTSKYTSPTNSATITGIDVSKVPYLTSIVANGESLIFVVMANTERINGVKGIVNFLVN